MTTYALTGKFVGDGAIAARNGRVFVAFKPPGSQRNVLNEVTINGTTTVLTPVGSPNGLTPGTFYKDGGCSLAFDDATGRLWMFNTCSPNPATGGDAVPILWDTGIVIAAGAASTVDAWARQQITAHELRLDRIAAGAAG